MGFTIEGNLCVEAILESVGFKFKGDSYEFDFVNGKLKATRVFKLVEIYLFHGFCRTERKFNQFDFELPLKVESLEQGLALIAYHLRDAEFNYTPEWLTNGLELFDHLPWKKGLKEYQETPKARVEHAWFRLIVKKLLEQARTAGEGDYSVFSFDGQILKIKCNDRDFVCQADGKAWFYKAVLKTEALNFLPKRIQNKDVYIFIWDGKLHIGNRLFIIETSD